MQDLTKLSISDIAYLVKRDWAKVNFAAKPYLEAMTQLHSISDRFGFDDGRSIVLYFLGNATSYRGETAKAVKAELKNRLKR